MLPVKSAMYEAFDENDPRALTDVFPFENMHLLNEGIAAYVVNILCEQSAFPPNILSRIDTLAEQFRKTQRQTILSEFPTPNYSQGICSVGRSTASEKMGSLFFMSIILELRSVNRLAGQSLLAHNRRALKKKGINTDGANKGDAVGEDKAVEGDTIAAKTTDFNDEKREKKNATEEEVDNKNVPGLYFIDGVMNGIRAILCFQQCSRKKHLWTLDDKDGEIGFQNAIKEFIETLTKGIPRNNGHGWNLSKLHGLTHCHEDVVSKGCFANFSAERPESFHKDFAKRFGRSARKRHVTFEIDCANRHGRSKILDHFRRFIEGKEPKNISDTDGNNGNNNPPKPGEVSLETRGATRYTVQLRGGQGCVSWTSSTEASTLTVPIKILAKICKEYCEEGEIVQCYTQIHIHLPHQPKPFRLRCHPNYRNDGPWYDWIWARWEDENNEEILTPAKVICVFQEPNMQSYKLGVLWCNAEVTQEDSARVRKNLKVNSGSKYKTISRWKFQGNCFDIIDPSAVEEPCLAIDTERLGEDVMLGGTDIYEVLIVDKPARWGDEFVLEGNKEGEEETTKAEEENE